VTPDGLVIRQAQPGDIGRVVQLLVLGSVPGGPPRAEDPDDPGPCIAALSEAADRGGVVLVADLDGEVVGVCQLIVFRHLQARGGLCAEVESLHVHPDHRSKGVGAALLGDTIARAGELGCYRLQLTSNTARPDAHRFYERLGFEPSHVGFKMRLT
jgi:GNAT superfamily N-acetyltransferase